MKHLNGNFQEASLVVTCHAQITSFRCPRLGVLTAIMSAKFKSGASHTPYYSRLADPAHLCNNWQK